MKAEKCTRVYVARAVVSHLVPTHHVADTVPHPALCDTRAPWLGVWSAEEFAYAESLPLCRRCADVIEHPAIS